MKLRPKFSMDAAFVTFLKPGESLSNISFFIFIKLIHILDVLMPKALL